MGMMKNIEYGAEQIDFVIVNSPVLSIAPPLSADMFALKVESVIIPYENPINGVFLSDHNPIIANILIK